MEDGRAQDEQFVLANEAALFGLEGDDYSVIRVVVDEPLTTAEAAEWVARTRWRLHLEGGQVLICSGFDPDCLADWQAAGNSEFVQAIALPAGDYQVVLYTYLHSMNGAVWLDHDFHPTLLPPLSQWFRQDHPSAPVPTWVAAMFAYDDLDEDDEWYPIRESVKAGRITIAPHPLHWIGYLMHFVPWTPELELDQPGPDGWFDAQTGVRVPALCPLGIATDCTADQDRVSQLDWVLGRS